MSTDIVERLFRLERSYPFTDVAHMLAEAGTEIRRLRSGRAAVIEECAKVVDDCRHHGLTSPDEIAWAIRALTGGPRD